MNNINKSNNNNNNNNNEKDGKLTQSKVVTRYIRNRIPGTSKEKN